MQDKSIINALLHIRAEAIRNDLGGLDSVDELLFQRGYDLSKHVIPKKCPRYYGRGKLRQATLGALGQGPGTAKEIAGRMAADLPNVRPVDILATVHVSLTTLKGRGITVNENEVWRLAQ